MTTGYAADEDGACALGDKLMQYGVIRLVVKIVHLSFCSSLI